MLAAFLLIVYWPERDVADEEEADWQLRLHQQEGGDLAGVGPVPSPRDVGSG